MQKQLDRSGFEVDGRVALVLLAALAACARTGPPQVGPEPIPAQDGALGVAYDAGSHELVFEMAPVDLPAHAPDMAMTQPPTREGVVPVNGWAHGYHIELLDKYGREVPHDLVHHVNIIVPGRRELFSPIMQRLGAAGHETGPVDAPRFVGYPLSRGDRVMLMAMLYNPTDQSYEGVRVRVRMPHGDRSGMLQPLRVYPFYLDVMPPAGVHEFDLPPGHFVKSWEGKPAVAGRILGMGGHVHRYATSLQLFDQTASRMLYEAKPILDDAGDVEGMPQNMFLWKLGIPLHTDHTYRLTVIYENPTGDTLRGGGMGALGGIMLASRGAEWPAIDPKNPMYLKDVETVSNAHPHEMMMDMGSMDMGGGRHKH